MGQSTSHFDPIKEFLRVNNANFPAITRLITDLESHAIPDEWLTQLLRQMKTYLDLPTRNLIWVFMLQSLQYVLLHPHVIEPIKEYTFHLYNMNRRLDEYCDPTNPVYLDKTWLRENSKGIIFSKHNSPFQQFLSNRDGKTTYAHTQELLNMFYRHDLPVMSKEIQLYRCLMLYDNTKTKLTQNEFVNYRITSTSLAPSYFTCPWNGVPRLDQLLKFKSDCRGLFIGFMSFVPGQDEVLHPSNLKFTRLKKLNKSQKLFLSGYSRAAFESQNPPDFVDFYIAKQVEYT
jgi:hypothetical protein